jgi:hypothetical protein
MQAFQIRNVNHSSKVSPYTEKRLNKTLERINSVFLEQQQQQQQAGDVEAGKHLLQRRNSSPVPSKTQSPITERCQSLEAPTNTRRNTYAHMIPSSTQPLVHKIKLGTSILQYKQLVASYTVFIITRYWRI